MNSAVQRLDGTQSVLDRLGKWRGSLDTVLKTFTAISEVCQYMDTRVRHPDHIQLHPAAKAALACVNVLYNVRFSPLIIKKTL